jgi:hypothetical protein
LSPGEKAGSQKEGQKEEKESLFSLHLHGTPGGVGGIPYFLNIPQMAGFVNARKGSKIHGLI